MYYVESTHYNCIGVISWCTQPILSLSSTKVKNKVAIMAQECMCNIPDFLLLDGSHIIALHAVTLHSTSLLVIILH